jgi:hypothetical protein
MRRVSEHAWHPLVCLRKPLLSSTRLASAQTIHFQLTASSVPPGTSVEQLGLRDLGYYVGTRDIHIATAKLQELRANFKNGAKLYRASVDDSDYLLWTNGSDMWEDELTLSSPTIHFGRALAAVLIHSRVPDVSVSTYRARVETVLKNFGRCTRRVASKEFCTQRRDSVQRAAVEDPGTSAIRLGA